MYIFLVCLGSEMLQMNLLFLTLFWSFAWHTVVPPGSWWILHQRSGPLSDPSCLVWPCLSSHHTTVCKADSVVLLSVAFSLSIFLPNPAIFFSPFFPLRGTVVLVLLVFCICFLVACIMYLHITRVQVNAAAFFSFLSSFPRSFYTHTFTSSLWSKA